MKRVSFDAVKAANDAWRNFDWKDSKISIKWSYKKRRGEMREKRMIVTGIVLALLVMAICGLGLYRQAQDDGSIEATIVYTD